MEAALSELCCAVEGQLGRSMLPGLVWSSGDCHTGEVAQSHAGAGQDLVGCAVARR